LSILLSSPDLPCVLKAEDCLALVAAVNRPSLRLMLDLNHA
jgi:hypothetical protein